MATDTLTPTDISSAFIAYIKADTDIVNVVGDEIREANWMNTDFVYPSIRIDGNRMTAMLLTGNCKGKWFNVNMSAYIFSEGSSSKSCQDLMGLIGKRFEKNVLKSAKLISMPMDIDYIPPVPNGIKSWRGEVTISARLYQL